MALTPRENFIKFFRNEPVEWMPSSRDLLRFDPDILIENIARGAVNEVRTYSIDQYGGKDMFGVPWIYCPNEGGSMEESGFILMEDINDWPKVLRFPDLDALDWEGCAQRNKEYLTTDKLMDSTIYSAFFERLISFLGFEGAAMSMIDEDCEDAIRALFDKLAELYIGIIQRLHKFFGVEHIYLHDDWGSQKETFFSPALAEEMIVPYMRRVTDYIHSRGKFCELHSCGMNMKQVPNFIKAVWDIWQGQAMNDATELYEKYGDQIILGVFPEPFDVNAGEDVHRAAARTFVDRFMQPGKSCILNFNDRSRWTIPFMEELYRYSRQRAAGEI